jgi:hypothetical protein
VIPCTQSLIFIDCSCMFFIDLCLKNVNSTPYMRYKWKFNHLRKQKCWATQKNLSLLNNVTCSRVLFKRMESSKDVKQYLVWHFLIESQKYLKRSKAASQNCWNTEFFELNCKIQWDLMRSKVTNKFKINRVIYHID